MYNKAIEIANKMLSEMLSEDVDNSAQITQLRTKKEQLQTQFDAKKKQLTDAFNQQIKTIDDQIARLGGAVVDTEK